MTGQRARPGCFCLPAKADASPSSRNRLLPRPGMEKKDSPSGINPVGGAFSVASVVSTVPWKAGRAFRIISGNICCRVLRTLFRDEPRPGPFHGQCRGWHPDSAVWRVWRCVFVFACTGFRLHAFFQVGFRIPNHVAEQFGEFGGVFGFFPCITLEGFGYFRIASRSA